MAPPPVIRLHPDDSVVIARATLLPGTPVADNVVARERVPAGHKVAVRALAAGEPILRYGQIIGFATSPIAPGCHVHVQNCGMGDFAKDYAFGVDATPTAMIEPAGHVRGHQAAGRARRHAQLHRHPDQRELQRARRQHGGRRVPPEPVHRPRPAGRLSRMSMAWWR